MNVTELPRHMDVDDAAIETDGVTNGVIVTVKLCSSKQDAVPAYTYTVCVVLITVPAAIGPTPPGEL